MNHLSKYMKYFLIVLLGGLFVLFISNKFIKPKIDWNEWNPTVYETGRKIEYPNGKVTILSVYATWCRDCHIEMKLLQSLRTAFTADQLQIILLSDEEKSLVDNFKEKYQIESTIYGKLSKPYRSLGVRVLPTVFLINKKGEVVETFLEEISLDQTKLHQLIEE